MIYTIDTENSITAFPSAKEAEGHGDSFSTQQELATLAADWPATRLVEVWNGIPGLTPVTKFKDRKTAVTRCRKCSRRSIAPSASTRARPSTTAPAGRCTLSKIARQSAN